MKFYVVAEKLVDKDLKLPKIFQTPEEAHEYYCKLIADRLRDIFSDESMDWEEDYPDLKNILAKDDESLIRWSVKINFLDEFKKNHCFIGDENECEDEWKIKQFNRDNIKEGDRIYLTVSGGDFINLDNINVYTSELDAECAICKKIMDEYGIDYNQYHSYSKWEMSDFLEGENRESFPDEPRSFLYKTNSGSEFIIRDTVLDFEKEKNVQTEIEEDLDEI